MKDFFKEHGIEFYSLIPLEKCKILKPYLLEKNGFSEKDNAIMLLIPYRSRQKPVNLTVYASCMDYHKYVEELNMELDSYVKAKYPQGKFKLFADHSPIDEVHASCISGLGFIGDNGLLINEKYSSFVFLAECITNLSAEALGIPMTKNTTVKECYHCGACKEACPSHCIAYDDKRPKSECLSAITQKKGTLTDMEKELILTNGSIWGCDICQSVCPFTKRAEFTPIEFFNKNIITHLTSELVCSLSDTELALRPFAWRGREIILRNTELYEEHIKKTKED